MNNIIDTLNEMQKEAVITTNGPLLLLAGAGSGKTRVLTHRIAYLIENGVSPYNILAITFTNKASKEMKERVEKINDQGVYVWVSTFHSTCVRILRQEIQHLKYDKNFTIYDTDDSTKLLKECLKELELNEKLFPIKTLAYEISNQKNDLVTPQQFMKENEGSYPTEEIAKVYMLYQKKLLANNALDFDDIIFKTVELFTNVPEVLEKYQDRFQYIMVDEYQDTNTAQYQLVRLLAAKNQNLCVVGDDDQSIYGWRGANIRNILDFEKDFPKAKTIKLEENYRCTKNILEAANVVIKNNRTRKDKTLYTSNPQGLPINFFKATTDYEESLFFSTVISEKVNEGAKFKDFAILYRTNGQSRSIEDKLVKANIPYRLFGGVRFYERREIKDLLAYMKLIHNTFDEIYLKRIINVPKRGIGDGTVDKLIRYSEDAGISLYESLSSLDLIEGLGNRSKNLKEFAEILFHLSEYSKTATVEELLIETIRKTNYMEYLKLEGKEEAAKREENINELLSKAAEFVLINEDKSLSAFLEEVSLVADIDNYQEDDDAVVLMTLHSSKGLEFPTVFIAGFEDGIFPSFRSLDSGDPNDLEEERRLCYVGITRAKENLYVSAATSRMAFGNIVRNPISRFFKEMPQDLLIDISYEEPEDTYNKFSSPTVDDRRSSYIDSANRAESYTKKATIPAPKDKKLSFEVGDNVLQIKYGIGKVKNIKPAGADYEVTVEFKGGVEKTLMAFLSKLRKV